MLFFCVYTQVLKWFVYEYDLLVGATACYCIGLCPRIGSKVRTSWQDRPTRALGMNVHFPKPYLPDLALTNQNLSQNQTTQYLESTRLYQDMQSYTLESIYLQEYKSMHSFRRRASLGQYRGLSNYNKVLGPIILSI